MIYIRPRPQWVLGHGLESLGKYLNQNLEGTVLQEDSVIEIKTNKQTHTTNNNNRTTSSS